MPVPEPRTPPVRLRLIFLACCLAWGSADGLAGAAPPSPAGSDRALLVEHPLAHRSGPRGPTLFALLPPEQTGVVLDNAYADPRMWGDLFPEFYLGAIGTGLTLGDFDRDGRPDIFAVSKTGQSRLFRNLGNWKFEDVTEKAGLAAAGSTWDRGLAWMKRKVGSAAGGTEGLQPWSQGATFADVDNDGWLDLYVCRYGVPNRLFINQRDGTFVEEAAKRGLAVSDGSSMAAFCDYDRDGWLDVYLQTNLLSASQRPNGQRDYLFRNNRDGTFTDVTERAGIRGEAHGNSVAWWDYDGDGWPDLYVANDFAVPDVLYRNNGDGTFSDVIQRVVPHMPFSSMGSDQGDIDNDGRLDFLATDMAATTREKDQRSMVYARTLSDEAAARPPAAPQYSRNALYVNTGTGRMLEAAQLAGLDATDWTWTVRFEDLDDDGRVDLYLTNGMVREFHNNDLLDRVMRSESEAERVRTMQLSPQLSETHLAFRNLGDLRFESVGPAWGLDQSGVTFGAALGDLDGDGDLDIVAANYRGGLAVLRNDSDTGHRLIVALRGTRSNPFGVGATVRIEGPFGVQTRTLVLTRGYLSAGEPLLHFGLGDHEGVERLTVSWPSGHEQTFLHLPADRRYEITEPGGPARPGPAGAAEPPATGRFFESARGLGLAFSVDEPAIDEVSVQPLLPLRQNGRGPAAVVADVDGDGREDVLFGGSARQPVRLVRATPGGAFSPAPPVEPGARNGPLSDGPLLVIEANGDGRPDLVVTRSGVAPGSSPADYRVRLLLNQGGGRFQRADNDAMPELSVNAGALAAADFDRDGQLDLFVGARALPGAYPLPGDSALLVNRGGRFEDVTASLAPALRKVGIVNSALWTDVDGDGFPDLLLALEWGPITCFHNDAGRGFSDWTARLGFLRAGAGWWTALASADFNGDGRPDYAAGNLGLNTRYRASESAPAVLLYGRFGGRSALAIEAYAEAGRLLPVRSRRDLGAQIPSVLRRYPQSDPYARATLTEILGADAVAAAQRFTATEFRSGLFLSQPDGSYRFAPLPHVAQIAPFQGLVAGDFDGDGNADLYALQNAYSSLSHAGRFDGGLSQLMLGDGAGGFRLVPVAESGLAVPGDAKALVVLDADQDGLPDFLATRNDAESLLFRNRPLAGRHFLRVALSGQRGNPTGVGARVRLETERGASRTLEVAAGSGHLSQSTSACFFGYTDNDRPRRVTVRWPEGGETSVGVPAGARDLEVRR